MMRCPTFTTAQVNAQRERRVGQKTKTSLAGCLHEWNVYAAWRTSRWGDKAHWPHPRDLTKDLCQMLSCLTCLTTLTWWMKRKNEERTEFLYLIVQQEIHTCKLPHCDIPAVPLRRFPCHHPFQNILHSRMSYHFACPATFDQFPCLIGQRWFIHSTRTLSSWDMFRDLELIHTLKRCCTVLDLQNYLFKIQNPDRTPVLPTS